MLALRFEDVEITRFTYGTAEELMSLPFAGANAAIPRNPPCAVCLWGHAWVRWARKRNVYTSMENGCQFCRLILEVLQIYGPLIDDQTGIGIYHYGAWIEIAWMTGSKMENSIHVYGMFDTGPFATQPGIAHYATMPVVQDIIGNTDSVEALQWISDMIVQCNSEHDKCIRNLDTPLPKRLLDVGEPQGSAVGVSDGVNIRLVETRNDYVDYICLSHCWGVGSVFKTTKENFDERIQLIKFSDLPKTFQDAVEITRKLGKRYLWIDSLCIIQNDSQDWQSEGLRMHETYGIAYLTIAASKTRGPDEGLFSESPHHKLGDFTFTLNEGESHVMKVRRKVQHFNSADGFPLLQRVWVFQERILSRRVLHFGPQELLWECMVREDCECGGINEEENWSLNTPKKSRFLVENNIYLWNHIVAAYSSLNLTKENDMLPALAGVMKKHKPAADFRYLAGLWDGKFLLFGLFWYTERKQGMLPGDYCSSLHPRPSPCRAPSWSWASVKNSIKYDEVVNFIPAVEIEGTKVVPAGRDSGGEVLYGEITLSGSAAMISCHTPADSSKKHLDVRCDGQLVGNLLVYPDYDWNLDHKWWIYEGQPMFCLHLATTRLKKDEDLSDLDEGGFHPDDGVRFLLLAMFNTDEPVFQRIGMAKIRWEKYKEQENFKAQLSDGTFVIC